MPPQKTAGLADRFALDRRGTPPVGWRRRPALRTVRPQRSGWVFLRKPICSSTSIEGCAKPLSTESHGFGKLCPPFSVRSDPQALVSGKGRLVFGLRLFGLGWLDMRHRRALAGIMGALAVGCFLATSAQAGWFPWIGSEKSGSTRKPDQAPSPGATSARNRYSSSHAESKKSLWESVAGLFGGQQAPRPKKQANPYVSKSKQANKKDESSSWWTSWLKPKEPPPPKTPSEWMKLKPVRW